MSEYLCTYCHIYTVSIKSFYLFGQEAALISKILNIKRQPTNPIV
jgi:hypothetical protein